MYRAWFAGILGMMEIVEHPVENKRIIKCLSIVAVLLRDIAVDLELTTQDTVGDLVLCEYRHQL